MAVCPPAAPKGLLYKCKSVLGAITGTAPETLGDGTPLVQAPLEWCGTGEPVCADSSVSGCISDSDGAPTAYGPLPAAPSPAPAAGSHSPIMSRLRINRAGEAVFPYTATSGNKPDQLLDIVDSEGNPIAFNAATGRFTLPAPTDIPEFPEIPELETYYHRLGTTSRSEVSFLENTRYDSDAVSVTNPSATLSMWVDILCTVQVGYSLDLGGRVNIQPYIFNGVSWTPVWGELQPEAATDLSMSRTITFGTGQVLAPGASLTTGVAVELQESTVGLVTAAGPLSLFIKAVGHNYDAG